MLDVGFSEIVLLAVVALVVLGPEKLPHAARMAGAWYARIRNTVRTLQNEISQEVNAAEIRARVEKELAAIKSTGAEAQQQINNLDAHIRASVAGITDTAFGSTTRVQPLDLGARYYYWLCDEEQAILCPPAPFLPSHNKNFRHE